ncbi:hypothetical protein R3P38DRAFT_2803944 [Favolaschia claudopus]|uniref:Uncharacterized protein n=1 Tax=Favolaschia claudopus TaxID=2862362 RepID=A0AAV9ZQW1_9AGAR
MASPSPPPFITATSASDPNPATDNIRTRTLRLAGEVVLTFSEEDVPDPPAISYAHRGVNSLLADWDDDSTRWPGTSPLTIKGVPIAVKYWSRVYKYWKSSQWQGVKKNWFDWKVLVTAITAAPSINEFWAKYSVPGKDGVLQRMKYTPLLNQLTRERKAEDARIAAIAVQELTPEQLTYRNGGQYRVMRKVSTIAARYRELKGLVAPELGDEEEEEDN